jgi:hypothetical protein
MAAVNADREPDSQAACNIDGRTGTHPAGPQLSARARSSIAAPTPQNLTSGRRNRGRHQNSSYSRSSGSEGRNQSLSRHLTARTLCGPPAEIGRGSASLADGWCSVRLRAVSCRLQYRSLRNFTVRDIAPERDQQLARERHNGNPSHPPAFGTHACAEPSAQCAIRLMPDP